MKQILYELGQWNVTWQFYVSCNVLTQTLLFCQCTSVLVTFCVTQGPNLNIVYELFQLNVTQLLCISCAILRSCVLFTSDPVLVVFSF